MVLLLEVIVLDPETFGGVVLAELETDWPNEPPPVTPAPALTLEPLPLCPCPAVPLAL